MPKLLFTYLKYVTQNLEILPIVQNLKSSHTLLCIFLILRTTLAKKTPLLQNTVFSSKESMSTNSFTWNNFNIYSNSGKNLTFLKFDFSLKCRKRWNASAPRKRETKEEWAVTCLKNRGNKDILKVCCIQALGITRSTASSKKPRCYVRLIITIALEQYNHVQSWM